MDKKQNTEDVVKPTLIIADDNQEILDFIADDLSDHYHTLKATNGKEVLDYLAEQPIHLVVSDVMMPVMDGYELCREIKSNVEYSHIPIVLLTAKNTLQSKIKGLEEGADAYIEKPFSIAHLQAQIQSLLANRNKVRTFFANSPLAHINTMAHNKADELFLEKLNSLIQEHISDPDLDVEKLAQMMYMSRPTLYRKIKAISDLTPNDLINISRLKKAAELLLLGQYKIYEIAFMVGYNSQTHFGRNFQKQFGSTPTEYIELHKKKQIGDPFSYLSPWVN